MSNTMTRKQHYVPRFYLRLFADNNNKFSVYDFQNSKILPQPVYYATQCYKKYFYALRPLLAAIWIEQTHRIPPVLFSELTKMELEPELRAAIEDLLERKKVTTEGEKNPHIPVIIDFIRDELKRQKIISNALPDDRTTDGRSSYLLREHRQGRLLSQKPHL